MDDSVSKNPVERLFQIELEGQQKNLEVEDEPATERKDNVMKLRCYIDNNNNPISNLDEGLEIGLQDNLEKFSQIAQRNCVYEVKQKISKLPSYLAINFVRFYWKAES